MKMLLSLPQGFFNGFLRSGETTQEGTLSSLATVSTIQESLDAFGESNRTCVENRRNLFHPPSSPSKPKRTSQYVLFYVQIVHYTVNITTTGND